MVKIAKDQSVEPIPQKLYKEGNLIDDRNVCDEYARYFDEKVKNIVDTTTIDENIYNGERKIYSNSKMFMNEASVKECILDLKIIFQSIFVVYYYYFYLCVISFVLDSHTHRNSGI